MNIAILTQSLNDNYGCILQNYALQKVLKDAGHNVVTIRRENKVPFSLAFRNFIAIVIRVLHVKATCTYSYSEIRQIRIKFLYFIKKYIKESPKKIYSSDGLYCDFLKEKYDAYIVGSDQVWRLGCSPCIDDYFLSFLPQRSKVKRLAYAASFGTDNWEFNDTITNLAKEFIQIFDLVTVREKSAVNLCSKYLNYNNAHFVLDPTMLLDKSDYEHLIENEKEDPSEGNLFCYILDMNIVKKETISEIEKQTAKKSFSVCPNHTIEERQKGFNLDDYVLPSITKWLRAFVDSDYVVTDSFHGTVFSIIFNIPFVVFGNEHRGNARFESLLELFQLSDRLTTSKEDALKIIQQPIDWNKVNTIREEMRTQSISLLLNALKR